MTAVPEFAGTPATEIGAAYVRLALAIEQHQSGYLDAYFGPPQWRCDADTAGRIALADLQSRARDLAGAVARGESDPRSRRFLSVQINAMQASLRILAGNPPAYADEVRELYDIEAQRVDDSVLDAAQRDLSVLLPGDGDLRERMQARRRRFEVPADRAAELYRLAMEETRRRTRALFELPGDESVEIALVHDKPWSAYNWYRGAGHSLIEVNADVPARADMFVELMAHEGYPGHHTEHAIKERALYAEAGLIEASVLLINAPECVVSEGIATTAADVLFTPEERERWQREVLYPRAGVNDDLPVDVVLRLHEAQQAMRAVSGNAALMLHAGSVPADVVADYIMRYSHRTRPEAERSIRFLTEPLSRSYTYTYDVGEELVRGLFARHDKAAVFKRLLSELLTPGDLRDWR
ncbi:MAG: hypothetical protein HZB53_13390 [Chloroflexi bacterium]|nr:hypothetical protein [Chloroflexota bacterium]